jgi:phosphoribosyl-AMP cyclohydrolase
MPNSDKPYCSESVIEAVIGEILFNQDGLVPVIAQSADEGEILMMAWMNADAIRNTLETSKVCYWSRSRGKLWRKGETSGQVQSLIEFRWDCDADTILVIVEQQGVACHTGRRNCFFNAIVNDQIDVIAEPEIDPSMLYT